MIISVVGAGGKTTVCNRLGAALAQTGKKVLLTTTTHILPPSGIPLAVGGADAIAPADGITAAAKERIPGGKLKGFSGREIDTLFQTGRFDFIIVEADGAKGRPVKAPGSREPVYPQKTALIAGVIGLDCLGQPVNEEAIHRSTLFSQITGAKAGDRITPGHLLALVRHPDGLFRHAPEGALKTVLLNKADILASPQEDMRELIEESGVPALFVSRDTNWTGAFIQSYILKTKERLK